MARKVQITSPREGSKLARAVTLLSNRKGGSKEVLEKKTGLRYDSCVWALKQKGYTVENIGDRGNATYRIA